MCEVERMFVYLAYLDDSEMKWKGEPWQVLTAALIPDSAFSTVQFLSSFAVVDLMPEDKREGFEEFHAYELYQGLGAFADIPQDKRFAAIEAMLGVVCAVNAKVAYGAINLAYLKEQYHASANPLDCAFRMCSQGINKWLFEQHLGAMSGGDITQSQIALLIVDECDKADKAILQRSFRSMRGKIPGEAYGSNLPYIHDDMYFGDSKYSIGIQCADLCSYFIARHLAGNDESEHFYKIIESQIVSAVTEPKQQAA